MVDSTVIIKMNDICNNLSGVNLKYLEAVASALKFTEGNDKQSETLAPNKQEQNNLQFTG